MFLKDLVHITTPFLRSANIEKDMEEWLVGNEGYIHTPLGRAVMRRIVDGIQPGGNRAWTIIGPYGSGKSTFALALMQMLTMENPTVTEKLAAEDPELFSLINASVYHGRFLPIHITGHPGYITPAICEGIERTLAQWASHYPELKQIKRKFKSIDKSNGEELAKIIEDMSKAFTGEGIFLVIDELGKFLEYCTLDSSGGDFFILQTLAELANRAQNPIILVTVLHQAFDNYVGYLSDSQRKELSKIQGRYESVAFQQPTEQTLRLLGAAIAVDEKVPSSTAFKAQAVRLANKAYALELLNSAPLRHDEFIELISSTAPLHPSTALMLGFLFKRFAQNERSIFAFLTSNEPYSFHDFIYQAKIDTENMPFLTPDWLYDYFNLAYGNSLYQSQIGTRWAQVETTLNRLHNPSPVEIKIIKFIGLMSIIGDIGKFRPTKEVIQFSLNLIDAEMEVLDHLRRKSIIVWRAFSDSFRLWDGSDVDIEEQLAKAKDKIDEDLALDILLNELIPPRPVVARRHSYQKGSLRFFDVKYASSDNLISIIKQPLAEADGRIIYVLCQSDQERASIVQTLPSLPLDGLYLILFLQINSGVKMAAFELKRLAWVKENTPELSNDYVARRELNARIIETETTLKSYLNRNFLRKTKIDLIYDGESKSLNNMFEFNQFLSTICDKVYCKSPEIRNELINRRHLSTSAAKARNLLIQAMIVNENESRLGITGTPPELSMYLSLLFDKHIHVSEMGTSFFTPPPRGSQLSSVWNVWHRFLNDTRAEKRSISVLFDELKKPPLGLLDGVIPVYVCAMLLERSLDIALYENGSYMPFLTVPAFERLVRNPHQFEIRYYPIENVHRDLFHELIKIGFVNKDSNNHLLDIVRALCVFAGKLSVYSRNTKSLSEASLKLRNLLLTAREPERLLYEDIPQALDLPISSTTTRDDMADWAKMYAIKLKESVREIGNSYNYLLEQIRDSICEIMGVSRDNPQEELQKRFSRIKDLMLDPHIKGFYLRLNDAHLEKSSWLESVATYAVGKPPSSWLDNDIYTFKIKLVQIKTTLTRLEKVAFAVSNNRFADSDIIRLGVTTDAGLDLEELITVRQNQRAKIDSVMATLQQLLNDTLGTDENIKMAVIAQLTKSIIMNRDTKGSAIKEA